MPNIVPGVSYQPIDFTGYPKRRKGRGACAHVAVSNAAALRPSGGNSWHFYLPKTGPAIQYVDLNYVAYAQLEGNPDLVSWESQGGVTNADGEPWTANQVEWGARIYAHLHETEGAPLHVMPDSKPGSRGLGYHRLGVDPWRVSGGQKWSSSRGKICPGAAKIGQIPVIVSRAVQLVGGGSAITSQGDNDMDANQDRMLREVHDELFKRLPNRVDGQSADTVLGYSANADAQIYHVRTTDVPNVLAQIAGLTAAVNALAAGAAGDGVDPEELRAVIREEMANTVKVQVSVSGAKGDPATGPVS